MDQEIEKYHRTIGNHPDAVEGYYRLGLALLEKRCWMKQCFSFNALENGFKYGVIITAWD